MNYYFKLTALKNLKRLPKDAQKRIVAKLDFYAKADNPLKFAEPIKDKAMGEFRLRIGDYRVIFDLVKGSIIILAVGHRKDVYK